jgi:hypothetical protein
MPKNYKAVWFSPREQNEYLEAIATLDIKEDLQDFIKRLFKESVWRMKALNDKTKVESEALDMH